MTTTIARTTTAAGVAAGAGLVLIELVFGDELEHVESAAVGVAAIGLALTVSSIGRSEDAAQIADAYWAIAAIAGVPAVLAHWGRRKFAGARRLGIRAGTIAERDYREERAKTTRLR